MLIQNKVDKKLVNPTSCGDVFCLISLNQFLTGVSGWMVCTIYAATEAQYLPREVRVYFNNCLNESNM